MKNIWQAISKKDFIFGLIILVLVIVISIARPSKNVKAVFGEDSVDVKSTQFSMNIPYEMVVQLELTDLPDLGGNVDGYNNRVIQTGLWENEAWGQYQSCLDLACERGIVVRLNDGQIFVINARNPEETAEVYEEFLAHVN